MGYKLLGPTYYAKQFDGSWDLFASCWKQYRLWLNGAIDDPQSDAGVMGWLDQIAAEKVNNPRSRYFVTG